MNVSRVSRAVSGVIALLVASSPLAAQFTGTANASPENGLKVAKLEARPATLQLQAGKVVPFKVVALDSAGKPVEVYIRYAADRAKLKVTDSTVAALAAGTFTIVATVIVPSGSTVPPATVSIPTKVDWPAIASVKITSEDAKLFAGTTIAHKATANQVDGSVRPTPTVRWTSSNPAIATVDRFGNVSALRPGTVTISAMIDGSKGETTYTVGANPVATVDLELSATSIRTGDVVKLAATPKSRAGSAVTGAPITWSFTYAPDDSIAAPGATGAIDENKFVAEVPGTYTIIATSGSVSSRRSIDVRPRDVVQSVKAMGRGVINDVHTADLWTFEGSDKRDYAIVGTWGGNGWAYMFDITDPANIVKTDSIQIDARTINDVTVSPDARYAVLAREGASNRVNGVVVLDLKNPAHPTVASRFDEKLTGGVHNMFATQDHLFALSNGDKYVIIDMKDIRAPKYVSEYDHPDSRIHDVWVHDGIAYSSEWGTGVVAVDVGNGKYGGTIEKPKLINTYPTKSGATHEIFPYFQKSTGKVYMFLGDEVMSRKGRAWEGVDYSLTQKGGKPQTMAGYTHIIDFTDPMNPKNVARYENPEFGTHDIIVENDILYQAYYDGGLRVVDVSGELLGNLASQAREISVYKPYDPQGYTANAPMVMNAMPYKGHIFFTDFNSGLWSAKLQPKPQPIP